jgi:hypothetical protein
MLRCRSIASLQPTVSTPPLVDFLRASHLDLFEQPARGFFQHPVVSHPFAGACYHVTFIPEWRDVSLRGLTGQM